MIFLGFNYLRDAYCWQPTPTALNNINNITIKNGIYDHFNITKDVSFNYITDLPGAWNIQTQMDANFEGNIQAGNIMYALSQISSIRVKRRIQGTFDWITMFTVPINKLSDVDFTKYDYTAKNGIMYEYSIVPVIGNTEGEYSINSVKSQFYGVFISDNVSNYKLLADVQYGNNERVNSTGIYQPYGSKYPVIVKNGVLSYDKGTVEGSITVFDQNDNLDRMATVNRLTDIKNFLTDSKSKILKDFNGNIWMIAVSDNLGISYETETGMGIAQLSFNWNEIGDSNNKEDLYYNGLIDTLE